jgi:hypothetical protein
VRSLAAVVVAALVCAGVASGADVGANDDTGKYASDAGASFYADMAALGLHQTVVTVRWRPSDPLALTERPLLDLTVAAARSAGLSVVFAVYPYPPRDVEDGLAHPDEFASWLAGLAHRYPGVRQYVVGNEPNQPAFWRPQFIRGRQQSARSFGPFLAAGYDALKGVDRGITVVGVGLSPRGNDRPTAKSNVSTSPVRFLAALGAWYRASGRRRPLMDGLSFHPYPNAATDPLSRGYSWPNAGFVNLDRIKQALWDAFAGTDQPTTLDGLRLYLDEMGWQVDTSDRDGYVGAENVPVTDEAAQAAIYGELVRRAACDPDIAQVNVFGFRDDALRTGFQAGLVRADGSPRPSATEVGTAVAAGVCVDDGARRWRPARSVAGARPTARMTSAGLVVALEAAEAAWARICLLPGVHTVSSASRVVAGRASAAVVCATASVPQNRRATVRLGRVPGPATLAVRLVAETNVARSTTLVRRLR